MKEVKIVKNQTTEENVSQRTVTFDVYVDGEYTITFNDIMDALEYKEALES